MKMASEMMNTESSKSKLPLEWTCVARKRATHGTSLSRNSIRVLTVGKCMNESSKDSVSNDEEEYSCSCCPPIAVDEDNDTNSDMTLKEEGTKNEAATRLQVINQRGIGIFCLHDTDTSWFQGYFIPKSSTKLKPIGVLAVQRDIDDCIQCAFGGYREIDMTLHNFLKNDGGSNQGNTSNSSSITVPVVCTGGDMLCIRTTTRGKGQVAEGSEVNIIFDATTIYTGRKAIPYLKTYFASLVKKQRELLLEQATSTDDSDQADITKMNELDLLPDCAIVCGDMVVRTTRLTTSVL